MSGGARQVTVTFAGEDRGLKKELKDVGQGADDVAASLKKIDASHAHSEMEGLSGKAGSLKGVLGGLKDSVGGELSGAFQGATGSLGPLGGAMEGLLGSGSAAIPVVGGVVAGVGALAGVAKVTIGEYIGLADKVRDFKEQTGASAQQSSRFIAVLDDLGLSSEAGAKALSALTKNADSGSFAKMGIEVARTKDGAADMVATFQNVLDKVSKIPDPIERANVLNASFGKSWQGILPLVSKTGDEFERMLKANEGSGQILSEKDLQSTADFKATMDALGDAWQKFVLETGKFAMPIVKIIVDDFAKFLQGVDKVGGAIGGLIDHLGPVETVLKAVAAGFLSLPIAAHALINMSFDKVEAGLQKLINVADKIAGPFINFPDDLFHNKQKKVKDGVDSVGESADKTKKATEDYTAALDTNGEKAKAAEAAHKALEKGLADLEAQTAKQLDATVKMGPALKTVDDASRALADAHRAETDASKASTAQSSDAAQKKYAEAQAAREHESATKALTDAKAKETEVAKTGAENVAAAEKTLAELRATQPDRANDVRKAEDDLARAKRDATTAATEEEAAQRRYQQVTGQLPADVREVTKAQTEQLAVRERLAALSDDLSSAQERLADAQNALNDASKNLPAEAQEAIAEARFKVADATERQTAAEKKLAEDRAAGKPAAELVKDERDVEEAKIATARATRDQDAANREWGDTSDELADKVRGVHEAERNLERVKRDQAQATKDEQSATKTLTEIQQGATVGSDREREAKTKLTDAHEKSASARDTERDASDRLAGAQKALAELPAKIAEAISKLRDTETKASEDRRAAHDSVTKVMEDQRLQALKTAADHEKAEGQKQVAIAKTKTSADEYTTKALALVDAEVAARANAAIASGKALDTIGEANARLNALEATRRQALFDGHTKTVAEIDGQIARIRDLKGEHDDATAKLKTNSEAQVAAAKSVGVELDNTAKPRVGSIDIIKVAADNAITGIKGRLDNEIVKTHTATLDAATNAATTSITNVVNDANTRWIKTHMGVLDANETPGTTSINNIVTAVTTNWKKNHDATLGVSNEANAKQQVQNVVAEVEKFQGKNIALGVSNEDAAKGQIGNVNAKLGEFKPTTITMGVSNERNPAKTGVMDQLDTIVGKRNEFDNKTAKLTLDAEVTKADQLKRYLELINTYALELGQYHEKLAQGVTNLRPPVVPTPAAAGLNLGGLVPGSGPDRDSVLASLTPGEFVLRRSAVDALGVDVLARLNGAGSSGSSVLGPSAAEIGAAVAKALIAAGAARPVNFVYNGTAPERVSPANRMRQVELMLAGAS